MDTCRKFKCALMAVSLIAAFSGGVSPCYANGSTYLTLGATMEYDFRLGVEHRWQSGPGIEAACGSSLLSLEGALVVTAEALVVLPLFRIGRSVFLDLVLGVPDLNWVTPAAGLMVSVGGAPRLRIELGNRWSLFARVGAGYPLFFEPDGFRSGSNILAGMWPDVGIGAAFRI